MECNIKKYAGGGGGGGQLQGEVEEVNPTNSFPNIIKDAQFLILSMKTNYGKA